MFWKKQKQNFALVIDPLTSDLAKAEFVEKIVEFMPFSIEEASLIAQRTPAILFRDLDMEMSGRLNSFFQSKGIQVSVQEYQKVKKKNFEIEWPTKPDFSFLGNASSASSDVGSPSQPSQGSDQDPFGDDDFFLNDPAPSSDVAPQTQEDIFSSEQQSSEDQKPEETSAFSDDAFAASDSPPTNNQGDSYEVFNNQDSELGLDDFNTSFGLETASHFDEAKPDSLQESTPKDIPEVPEPKEKELGREIPLEETFPKPSETNKESDGVNEIEALYQELNKEEVFPEPRSENEKKVETEETPFYDGEPMESKKTDILQPQSENPESDASQKEEKPPESKTGESELDALFDDLNQSSFTKDPVSTDDEQGDEKLEEVNGFEDLSEIGTEDLQDFGIKSDPLLDELGSEEELPKENEEPLKETDEKSQDNPVADDSTSDRTTEIVLPTSKPLMSEKSPEDEEESEEKESLSKLSSASEKIQIDPNQKASEDLKDLEPFFQNEKEGAKEERREDIPSVQQESSSDMEGLEDFGLQESFFEESKDAGISPQDPIDEAKPFQESTVDKKQEEDPVLSSEKESASMEIENKIKKLEEENRKLSEKLDDFDMIQNRQEDLLEENIKLKNTLHQKDIELDDGNRAAEDLRKQLAEVQESLDHLSKNFEQIKVEKQELEKSHEDQKESGSDVELRERVADLEFNLQTKQNLISQLEADKKKISGDSKETEEKLGAFQNKISELEKKNQELENLLASSESSEDTSSLAEEIEGYKKRNETVSKINESLERELADKNTALSKKEEELKELRNALSELSDLNQAYDELKTKNQLSSDKLVDIESEYHEKMESLQKDLQALKEKESKWALEEAELQKQLNSLRSEGEKKQAKLEEQESDIQRKEKERISLKEMYQKNIEDLEEKISDQRKIWSQNKDLLQKEVKDLQSKVQDLESRNENLSSELSRKESELEQKSRKFQESLKAKEYDFEEFKSDVERKLETLKSNLERKTKELDLKNTAYSEMVQNKDKEYFSMKGELEDKLKNIEDARFQLKLDLQNKMDLLGKAELRVQELDRTIQGLSLKVAQLEESNQQIDPLKQELQAVKEKANEQYQKFSMAFSEKENQLKAHLDTIEKQKREMESLENAKKMLEEQQKVLQKQVQNFTIEKEKEDLIQKRAGLQSKIDESEQQLKEIKDSQRLFLEEIEEKKAYLEQLINKGKDIEKRLTDAKQGEKRILEILMQKDKGKKKKPGIMKPQVPPSPSQEVREESD